MRQISSAISRKVFPNVEGMQSFTDYIITFVCWFVAIMLVLDILNLTSLVTHLLAGAGIVGIVLGFAFKDIASNGFAGFLIRAQRPFVSGDWVQINDYIGTVEQQGLLMTGIKTVTGEMVYVPNQDVFNGCVMNYSTFGKVRAVFKVGVSYGDQLEYVEKVALETIRKLPMVKDPEDVDFYFTDIGGATYNFEIRYWITFTERTDYLRAVSEGIKAVKAAFEKANISVAYNVLTLDFGVKGGVNLYDNPIPVKDVTPIKNGEYSQGTAQSAGQGNVEGASQQVVQGEEKSSFSSVPGKLIGKKEAPGQKVERAEEEAPYSSRVDNGQPLIDPADRD